MIRLVNWKGIEAGKAFQSNLRLLAWVSANRADHMVSQLIIINKMALKTPGLAELIPRLVSGLAGGYKAHKLTVSGVSMEARINSTTLVSTHYRITSNLTILQRGDDDYFVFFQQHHQHIFVVIRMCTPYNKQLYVSIQMDHCSFNIPDTPFVGSTTLANYAPPTHAGVEISAERLKGMIEEADHFDKMQRSFILSDVNGPDCLAVCVAHQVSQSMRRYNMGLTNYMEDRGDDTGSQTTINVNVMRKIAIPRLMLALVMALGMTGQLAPNPSGHKLKAYLNGLIAARSMAQSVIPYKDLIEALVTSSKINDLISYTGCAWKWSGSISLDSSVALIHQGMRQALVDWLAHGRLTYVLVEAKRVHYNYAATKTSLKYLSSTSGTYHVHIHMTRIWVK